MTETKERRTPTTVAVVSVRLHGQGKKMFHNMWGQPWVSVKLMHQDRECHEIDRMLINT